MRIINIIGCTFGCASLNAEEWRKAATRLFLKSKTMTQQSERFRVNARRDLSLAYGFNGK